MIIWTGWLRGFDMKVAKRLIPLVLLVCGPVYATCEWTVPQGQIDSIFIFSVYESSDGNTAKTDLDSEDTGLLIKFSNNAGDEFIYNTTALIQPVAVPGTGAHTEPSANQVRLSHLGESTMELQAPDAWFADTTAGRGWLQVTAPGLFAVDCVVMLEPMTAADITLAVNASDNAKQSLLVTAAAAAADAVTTAQEGLDAVNGLYDDFADGTLDVRLQDGAIVAATFGADAITNSTLAASVGTELAAATLGASMAEPTVPFTWPATLQSILSWQGAISRNKILQTDTTQTLRNDADSANLGTNTQSDDGTTYTRGEWVP